MRKKDHMGMESTHRCNTKLEQEPEILLPICSRCYACSDLCVRDESLVQQDDDVRLLGMELADVNMWDVDRVVIL